VGRQSRFLLFSSHCLIHLLQGPPADNGAQVEHHCTVMSVSAVSGHVSAPVPLMSSPLLGVFQMYSIANTEHLQYRGETVLQLSTTSVSTRHQNRDTTVAGTGATSCAVGRANTPPSRRRRHIHSHPRSQLTCTMKTAMQLAQGRPDSMARCTTIALHLLAQFTRAGWAQRHLSLFPALGRSAARSVLNVT